MGHAAMCRRSCRYAALCIAILALLSAFQPPDGVQRLVIAADRDVAGLVAAWKLRDRIQIPAELRVSRLGDFAEDVA